MKKLSMSAKIIIASIVDIGGDVLAAIVALLMYFLLKIPLFVCILLGIGIMIITYIIAHFIGRCPYCHMSLHTVTHGWLFEYCPYCGHHF